MPEPSQTSLKRLTCTYPDCHCDFRLPVQNYRLYRIHASGSGWFTCICPSCQRSISLKYDTASIGVLLKELPTLATTICNHDGEFAEHYQHPLADIPIHDYECADFVDAVMTALDDYARELRDAYPNLRLS